MSDKPTESPNKNDSGEVVNGFRSCRDLSDIVPLYSARGLYLKPAAKIHISIKLPQLKIPGITTTSNLATFSQTNIFCSLEYF